MFSPTRTCLLAWGLWAMLLSPTLAAHPAGLLPGDTYHLAFVTSSLTVLNTSRTVPPSGPTDWGGIPAADWVVSFHAAVAGLPGTEGWDFDSPLYQAILSDGSVPPGGGPGSNDAIDRLNISGPIYNGRGELVALDTEDLFSGSIRAPIMDDEFGVEITGNTSVWSGTASSGFWTGDSCGDWDSSSSSLFGAIGQIGSAASTWILQGSSACNQSAHLYGLSPAITVPLLGDFNEDNTVDAADYTVWQSSFGSTSDLRADANHNGIVDAADFTVWRDNLGAEVNTPTVPEPTTLLLLGLLAPFRLTRTSRNNP